MWSRKKLFPLKTGVLLKNVNSMRKLVSKTSSGALRVPISHEKQMASFLMVRNAIVESPKASDLIPAHTVL